MCSEPSTRKPPPAMKYFASLPSCAVSSSGAKGSTRTGGARPGSSRIAAYTRIARSATKLRNSSEVTCCRYTPRSAQAGLDEVDREHDGEVEHDHHGED